VKKRNFFFLFVGRCDAAFAVGVFASDSRAGCFALLERAAAAQLLLSRRVSQKVSNFGFDVLNLVAGGFELGDAWFRALVDGVLACLRQPVRSPSRLRLLLIVDK
jgi:hypothetical protein